MKKHNIGYCCGVWDLGHSAHIKFLKRAKSLASTLIVGVVEDKAIKEYKGDSRPILSTNERIEWVKTLDLANIVVAQKEFTPSSILEMYKPTIFIKGADQKHIGEKKARDMKIKIVYLKRTPGISTTDIIKRIKDNK